MAGPIIKPGDPFGVRSLPAPIRSLVEFMFPQTEMPIPAATTISGPMKGLTAAIKHAAKYGQSAQDVLNPRAIQNMNAMYNEAKAMERAGLLKPIPDKPGPITMTRREAARIFPERIKEFYPRPNLWGLDTAMQDDITNLVSKK